VIDLTNPASWPVTLTLHDVALIDGRSVDTIRRHVMAGAFEPMPMKGKPLRWRRMDVVRVYEPVTPMACLQRRTA
jgi:hypothetical protein